MMNFIQPKTVSNLSSPPSIAAYIPVSPLPQDKDNFTIHKVLPNDTLDRISLIYDVNKDAIRKANGFTGDEIYMKKELVIPNSSKQSLII